MCVRILKLGEEDKYCVEFSKTAGDNVLFHEHFNDIIKKLDCFNDASSGKQEVAMEMQQQPGEVEATM